MIDLNNLSDKDAYSLLFILMSKMNNMVPYSSLSELSFIMNKDSLLNFISYYGGTTIKVPTANEFHKAARVLILYQSYYNQNLSWEESLKLAGYDGCESVSAKIELQHFNDILNKERK